MGGSFNQVYVKCPYYISDNGNDRITCEGIVPGSNLQNFFRKKRDYELQIEIFCSGCYWNCEICTALDRKYYLEEEEK